MMDVFRFESYKDFLNAKLDEMDRGGRGSRASLSRKIGCHTAYTTQVLRGSAHFSSEQGEAINDFLGHTDEEGDYFLLMLSSERSGSAKLTARLQRQMAEIRKSRESLKNRFQVGELSDEQVKSTYYSSWVYGAIHALASVPNFQSTEAIAKYLNLSLKQVAEVFEFLLKSGIIIREKDNILLVNNKQIHLGVDSPMIVRHHINWRLKAMQMIESDVSQGLHYSSVVSLSEKDYLSIRESLILKIKDIKAVVKSSKEEKACALSLDFFSLMSQE